MISPKEEAKELIDKMYFSRKYAETENYILQRAYNQAKDCALIAVDKILKVAFFAHDDIYNHYLEVKIELEKL